LVACLALGSARVVAQVGMAADDADRVTVFDAATNSVLGSVPLPPGGIVGDCSISHDGAFGFVTDFRGQIWVIDLTTSPPALAAGINPIPISNYGEDTELSLDGRFLVVTDGSNVQPVSVVDLETRTEVATFALGTDANAVDVCEDGSVLVTSNAGSVRRLRLDASGQLTDTGDSLSLTNAVNVYCAPGGATGIAVGGGDMLQSFTIPGLAPLHSQPLGGTAICGAINDAGDLFVGRSTFTPNVVKGFGYDAANGQFGPQRFDLPVASALAFYGMDQMEIDPSNQHLYVAVGGGVAVYELATGSLLTTITGPSIVSPTGICFARSDDFDEDGLPNAGDNCRRTANPDQLDGDGDGVGDLCDNCPATPNADQGNLDRDAFGDACDTCTDGDQDGFGDPGFPLNTCLQDNCPANFNPDQADADLDGIADACDNCPGDSNLDQADADADGDGDICDNCAAVANPDQADADSDGPGDACDNCPLGSNADQADGDGDGVGDLCDNCALMPNSSQADPDGDGVGSLCDNCPHAANPDQADPDGDGTGEACDTCVGVPNGPVTVMYAVDGASGNPSSLHVLDPANGSVLRTIGPTGFNHVTSIDIDPTSGIVYAVTNESQQLLILDPDTGAGTVVGNTGHQIPDLAFDPAGRLYGWSESVDNLVSIDLDTGQATIVGGCACSTSRTGLASDSAGKLYMKSNSSLNTLNPATGAILSTVSIPSGETNNPLEFDASDVLFTGLRTDPGYSLRTLDPATGALGIRGSNPLGFLSGIAISGGQRDRDQDGLGDACDPCPNDADNDADGDGLCGDLDNCPGASPADQTDTDGDGRGDLCDNCLDVTNYEQTDSDGDGLGDSCDGCPLLADPDQADGDSDGVGDACDNCADAFNPAAPASLESVRAALNSIHSGITALVPDLYLFTEGESGTSIADGGDDMYDGGNRLNTNRASSIPYTNGAIVASDTRFGPGSRYFTAKYPGLFAMAATGISINTFTISGNNGADGSGLANGVVLPIAGAKVFVKRVYNAEDPSINHIVIVPNPPAAAKHVFSANTDNGSHQVSGLAGAGSIYYLLVARANGGYLEDEQIIEIASAFLSRIAQPDSDGDGLGDACDACTDRDLDGFGDPGFPGNLCAVDNCPDAANPDQADADVDGRGDLCDNCAAAANPGQEDGDGDGDGNVCDNCATVANADQADGDADGRGNACDNCPLAANANQANGDGDTLGDACDNCIAISNSNQSNLDGDAWGDACDLCPAAASNDQAETDGDGVGDACDNCPGTFNPKNQDGLEGVLAGLNAIHPAITGLVPNLFLFSEGAGGSAIADGGSDMYDGGNILATENWFAIPYTNGSVGPAGAVFGPGSRFFTVKLPGLFVLGASSISINNFSIFGDNGHDGAGTADGVVLNVPGARVLAKRVYGTANPSINHIVIVPDAPAVVNHSISTYTNDDYHSIFGLAGAHSLYYLLVSSENGGFLSNDRITAIANRFLLLRGQPDLDLDGAGDLCDPCSLDAADDADADALCANVDNCPLAANPDQLDYDSDGAGDLCDNCAALPNPDQADPDGDGLGDICDNCPDDANLTQTDADSDGPGDACDLCPSLVNPLQDEALACLEAGAGGGECLAARIETIDPLLAGEIRLFALSGATPPSIRFEILATSCLAAEALELSLNGVVLGSPVLDPARRCTCAPGAQIFTASDAPLLAAAWLPGATNTIRLRKPGQGDASFLAWVRARFDAPGASEMACLFDTGGGACTEADLCSADSTGFAVDTQYATDVLSAAHEELVALTPFAGGLLPASIDLAGLSDGPARVCVTAPGTTARDCVAFTKAGELDLAINGAGCRPPAAVAEAAAVVECTSPAGASVLLDGSGSTDPSSTPGTNDGIVRFEWVEDLGLPDETLLDTGETVSVVLPLGAHAITLRVTDALGQTAVDTLLVTVQDTTAPDLAVVLSPGILWPPNHRMIEMTASLGATDLCGTPAVALASVTSNEPDDAAGDGDGDTTDDIQGTQLGTPDDRFQLRAERRDDGTGRFYAARYVATDSAGNTTTITRYVLVPHDRGGKVDPIELSVADSPAGTIVSWDPVPNARFYNVIRGRVADIVHAGSFINLGPVDCIEPASLDTTTAGSADPVHPDSGQVFFYLVEYDDGAASSYGSESSGVPAVPASGACGS